MPDSDERDILSYSGLFSELVTKAKERAVTFHEIPGSGRERYEVKKGKEVIATISADWKHRYDIAMSDDKFVNSIEKTNKNRKAPMDFIETMKEIETFFAERESGGQSPNHS